MQLPANSSPEENFLGQNSLTDPNREDGSRSGNGLALAGLSLFGSKTVFVDCTEWAWLRLLLIVRSPNRINSSPAVSTAQHIATCRGSRLPAVPREFRIEVLLNRQADTQVGDQPPCGWQVQRGS